MKKKEYGVALNWNYITISLILFVIITILVIYMPSIRDIDGSVLSAIRRALAPYPQYIPVFVSNFGDISHHLMWPQITACCVLVSHAKYIKAGLLVVTVHCAYLLTDLIKNFVCRTRPDGCNYSTFSFPSGHSIIYMCFYGILIYLVARYVSNDFWRNVLIAIFGIWILLLGISRLWLGVHFPLDVIGGMLVGFILVNLYIIVTKYLSR